ncbi:GGDEF domain-containing protein [Microvirga rosea]|uniref:GGDEF domain-containing protein n=1 Tax=Microvirga rosea TaxID=2715425 RepID=UPI001D0B30C6|nr:GGDEF domain-containing protein [Microvirga rosea]MCB8822643.1 GGDEF domain-containing protein [Microvirga rosea]
MRRTNADYASMGVYSALSRLRRPRSYMGRVLLICFVGTHIPLIVMCIALLAMRGVSGPDFWLTILTLLVATLVATAVTLSCVYGMLAPVQKASAALQAYREHRTLPALPRHFTDEAGLMMAQVQDTLVELDTAIHDLARAADTDALTGIGNRRWLMRQLAEHFQRAQQQDAPLSVIIFDLDRFKSINDQYGHGTGDAVLIGVSRFVKSTIPSNSLFARSGGEEFCIVLPGSVLSQAADVARTLQRGIAAKAFGDLDQGFVTASFGVAAHRSGDETIGAVFGRADELLYRAKGEGRNQVVV